MVEKLPSYEYGSVELKASDIKSGLIDLHICSPFILLQGIQDVLYEQGRLHNISIRDPLAVWIPKLGIQRLKSEFIDIPNLTDVIHNALRDEALKICNIYVHLQNYVRNPLDLIYLLPLGIYVNYEFQCSVDSIPKTLERLHNVDIAGIHELIWAMATILKDVLLDFERIRTIESIHALQTKNT